MIVTIKAPSAAAAKRGAFQASMQMGLDTDLLDDCFNIVVHDLWKANHLAGMIDGEVIAVVDKMAYDTQEEAYG